MGSYEYNCKQCNAFVSVTDVPRRGDICFKCHIQSINLGFTYGKDNFHGDTIGERQRQIVANAKAKGVDAVPASEYGF